jgi:hypothetical protein
MSLIFQRDYAQFSFEIALCPTCYKDSGDQDFSKDIEWYVFCHTSFMSAHQVLAHIAGQNSNCGEILHHLQWGQPVEAAAKVILIQYISPSHQIR